MALYWKGKTVRRTWNNIARAVHWLSNITIRVLGGGFLIVLILAFTDVPYWAYYHLGVCDNGLAVEPQVIVVLGGAGMPSPDGLQRTHFGSVAAGHFPNSLIYIALPSDPEDEHPMQQPGLMAKEMVRKGVNAERIMFLHRGYNTRTQALELKEVIREEETKLLIVTAPEHMFRAIRTFKRVGFKEIGALPTFEVPLSEDQILGSDDGLSVNHPTLRYNFWSYLQYEVRVLREYTAITYYWLMGWI